MLLQWWYGMHVIIRLTNYAPPCPRSPVLQPQVQSIVTSPQLQPMTIQHQRVLTPSGQTIQTLSTAPTTVHTMQQQVQQVPVCCLTIVLLTASTFRKWFRFAIDKMIWEPQLLNMLSSGSGPAASDSEDRLTCSDHTQTRWHTGAVHHAEPHRDHHLDHAHPEHSSSSPGIQLILKFWIINWFTTKKRKIRNLIYCYYFFFPRHWWVATSWPPSLSWWVEEEEEETSCRSNSYSRALHTAQMEPDQTWIKARGWEEEWAREEWWRRARGGRPTTSSRRGTAPPSTTRSWSWEIWSWAMMPRFVSVVSVFRSVKESSWFTSSHFLLRVFVHRCISQECWGRPLITSSICSRSTTNYDRRTWPLRWPTRRTVSDLGCSSSQLEL